MERHQLEQAAVALLRHHQFAGADARALADLLERGTAFKQPGGTVLYREGEKADALFFLLEGRLQITVADGRSQQRELAVIEAPAIVGHVSMVDGAARNATCGVMQLASLVAMDASTYRAILDQPSAAGTTLRRILLSSLVQQQTAGNDRLRSLLTGIRKRDERRKRRRPTPSQPAPEVTDPGVLVGEETELDLMDLAGVAAGWRVDTDGMDELELTEDEEMRRSRLHRKR
jgi:CRP-like cAMP-binding protein